MFIAKLKYHNGATFTPRFEDGTYDPKRRKPLVESAGVAINGHDALIRYIKSLTPSALAFVESVEVYTCPKPRNEWLSEVAEHAIVGHGMRLEGSYLVKGNRVEVIE